MTEPSNDTRDFVEEMIAKAESEAWKRGVRDGMDYQVILDAWPDANPPTDPYMDSQED